jgi:hypothetical protein
MVTIIEQTADQIGGSVSGYRGLSRCVAVTVTRPGGRWADRMFMHRRA